ncbi:MAG: ester cyclase [Acidobacteria bacterium]|nr:ester cyclase [Acidobacteriota bacterium]
MEANKVVIRRLYSEVMGEGNMAAAEEIFDPNYVDHMPIMSSPNRDGLLESVEVTRIAFPDVAPRIIAEIAEEEWVAIAVEARGTHKGKYFGIAPTGKPVTWTEIHFWRVKEGKIVEHYGNVSLFETMKQIGAHNLSGTFKK